MGANISSMPARGGVCSGSPRGSVADMSTRDARLLVSSPPALSTSGDEEKHAEAAGNGHGPSLPDRIKLRLSSDEELAAKLQHGQTEALTVLFERYSPQVYRHARRVLKNDAEAEDLVQQVFLDVLRSAGQFNAKKASFKTWLLMFTYCQTVNRWRQLRARHYYDSVSLEEILPAVLEGAQQAFPFQAAEAICLVEQALRLIQPRQRTVIELVYYEGLTPQEIADRTGESVPVVRHNLYRGLDKIRVVLGEAATKRKSTRCKDSDRV